MISVAKVYLHPDTPGATRPTQPTRNNHPNRGNVITREQATHIAQLTRTIRPKWDELTIINLLAHHQQTDLDTITKAAIAAATNPKAETPKAINWPEHWPTKTTATAVDDTTHQPDRCHNPDHGSNPGNCSQCRSELIAPRDPHPCPQPLHRYWAHNCPDCRNTGAP